MRLKRQKKQRLSMLVVLMMVFSLFTPISNSLAVGMEGGGPQSPSTTPAAIQLQAHVVDHSKFQEAPLVVSVNPMENITIEELQGLSYKLEINSQIFEIPEENKKVEAGGLHLLQYLPFEFNGHEYDLTVRGYDGETLKFEEVYSQNPLNIRVMDYNINSQFQGDNLDKSLNVNINGIGLTFEGDEKDNLSLEATDPSGKIIYAKKLDSQDIRAREYPMPIFPFEEFVDFYDISATLKRMTDVIESGETTLWLRIGDSTQPLELGKLQNNAKDISVYGIYPQKTVFAGQNKLKVSLSGMNIPNKDYLNVKIVDSLETGAQNLVKNIETAYDYTDVNPGDDSVGLILNIETLDNLIGGKTYYFLVEASDGKQVNYTPSSFTVQEEPGIGKIDISKYLESRIIFEAFNFEPETQYDFEVVPFMYNMMEMTTPGTLSIGKGSASLNEDVQFDVLFKDENDANFVFELGKSYNLKISNQEESQEILQTSFYIPATSESRYINSVKNINVSHSATEFIEKIGLSIPNLKPEDIRSISLVDRENQSNIVAQMDMLDPSFLVQGGSHDSEIEGIVKVTGTPTVNIPYIYIIELIDGSKIKPMKQEYGGIYYYETFFRDAAQAKSIVIPEGAQLYEYQNSKYIYYVPMTTPASIGAEVYGITNVDDNSKVELYLEDASNQKVAQLDPTTLEKSEDFMSGVLNQISGKNIVEGQEYNLVFAYDGNKIKEHSVIFTSKLMVGSYYGRSIIPVTQYKFDIKLYNTLNLDVTKADVLLVPNRIQTIPYQVFDPMDMNGAILVNSDFVRDEESRDYLVDITLQDPLEIGQYRIFIRQGTEIVNLNQTLNVTDKTMILSGDNYYYDYEEEAIKEFVIEAINLNRDSSYHVYVYPGYYHPHGGMYQSTPYPVEDLDMSKLIKEMTSVTINKDGNIVFTIDEVKDLKVGQYKLFFEMDDKVIGQGFLNIRAIDKEDFKEDPAFYINGGKTVTDSREVILQIKLAGNNQIRIANTLEELNQASYQEVTAEELQEDFAQRTHMLLETEGLKTVLMQFKDSDGVESEVISRNIKLESQLLDKPFDVAHNGGDKVLENSTVIVSAKGNQNVEAYMEILDTDYNKISKLSMRNTGTDSNGKYMYERSFVVSGEMVKAKYIRVYFANSSGKVSEEVLLPITISKLGSIEGSILKKIGSQERPVPYLMMTLQKKSASLQYINFASISADQDAKFKFAKLSDGDYRLVAYDNSREITKEFKIENGQDITNYVFMIESEFNKVGKLTLNVKQGTTPVQDVSVSIGSWQTGHYVTGDTDASGNVVFEDLPTKDSKVEYYVSAYKDGLSKWENIQIGEGNNSSNLTFPTVSTISGKVTDANNTGIANQSVFAVSNNWKYSSAVTRADGTYTINIVDAEDGATYKVQLNQNAASKKVSIDTHDSVAANDSNVNFTLYDGVKVYGDVKDASGNAVKNIDVYSSSMTQWFRAKTNVNGEFDFGYALGIGTHTVAMGYDGQYISQQVTITREDIQNEATKQVQLRLEDKSQNPFKGEGNNVKANVNSIQKGKNITVKVNVKNNGTTALSNVELEAVLPDKIALSNTPGFDNQKKITIDSIGAGESKDMTFIVYAQDDYDKASISIPAYARVGGNEYTIGFAEIEVVNINIKGPSIDKDGKFAVYGETVEGGQVTIIDKVTDKAIASTKPSGKWYTANVTLSDGNQKLVAQVEKNGNIAVSDLLEVKVSSTEGIEIEDVEVTSPGGQKVGVNKDTGIAAFSVWVDGSLRGKDINARVKLSNSSVIQEAKYEFAEKEYTATLDDKGYYQANITGWSGSGVKLLKLHVKVNGEWIIFTVAEVTILIDPSGYVEDKYSKERLVGASAICEVLDGSEWKFWDASKYGQLNPQLTDENGEYGWMVPDGTYRVKVVKEGYEDYVTTEDRKYSGEDGASNIIIPPPRDDVFISMVNISEPQVTEVNMVGNDIAVTFSKAMDSATANSDTFKVKDPSGNLTQGTIKASTDGKTITFVPTAQLASEQMYAILLDGVKDYAGTKTAAKGIKYTGEIKSPKVNSSSSSSSSSGGGGAGLPVTEIPAPVDVNKNTSDQNGNVTINTNSVLLVTESGTVSAKLKSEDAILGIEQAVKEAKAGTTPRIVMNIMGVKDANLRASIPGDVISRASANKVDIVITSNEVQYVIPYGLLTDVSATSGIEFVSRDMGTQEVKTDMKQGKFVKAVELSLLVDKKAVNKFNKPLEVRINVKGLGNSERMAIYYLNESKGSLDFVSGTVKDNFLVMNTNHYSKYVILERSSQFSDITGHWAESNINAMAAKNILGGYVDGTFKPENTVTRAEFARMMVSALELKSVDYGGQFKDVKANDWFASAVATAYSNGVVSGYPDGTFNPNGNITRAEMVSIISKTLKNIELSSGEVDRILADFDDAKSIQPWAREAMAKAVKAGVISGSNNKLNPNGITTRAQAATVVYKVYSK